MVEQVTWQDCIIAMDELIETIKLKINEDPEHGELWQQMLSINLVKRQEVEIIANIQEEQQFIQSLEKICMY